MAVSAAAAASGLHVGQALTQALAVCPALAVVEADPAADSAALARLAEWCDRFTPLAAADPPDGVWLDITGCTHPWGISREAGEAGLAAALAGALAKQGIACRIAVAGTAGAAWALARRDSGPATTTILPRGAEAAALAALPMVLLRLDERTVARLRRVGLRRIGELARQPRGEVSARFGPGPVLRLDQAFGRAAEPITWQRAPVPWSERLAFAEPIGTPAALARGLGLLAERLCARLAAAQRGGHRFTAYFLRVDGARPTIAIGTALPVREAAYVARLLADRLETVDPGFGVEAMLLEADETAPLLPPQLASPQLASPQLASPQLASPQLASPQLASPQLASPQPANPKGAEAATLAETVDGLANRAGGAVLWRDAPFPSHVPERAVRRVAPLAPQLPGWEAAETPERPLRLLSRPEPITVLALLPDDPPARFVWRGAAHLVRAATGPERIGAEWWRRSPSVALQAGRAASDMLRDYYRVEDSEGARFWVFRTGLAAPVRWFLHGIFG
jgi:protein ImuB